MDVLTLLKDLGVITVSAGALTLISRYAIKQYFEKRLESYRTELEKEKIQYSELHEQRGQVIAKLYEKLGEFEEDMRSLVKPFQATGEEPQDEKLKKAAESGEEFRKYFKKNRIYFSEEVCETMDKLQDEFKDVFNDFAILRVHDDDNPHTPDDDIEKWVDDWNKLNNGSIQELKGELEDHFREILGVGEDHFSD